MATFSILRRKVTILQGIHLFPKYNKCTSNVRLIKMKAITDEYNIQWRCTFNPSPQQLLIL